MRDHEELTQSIIGKAYTVLNTLGPGFLEKVYENALVHELNKTGLDIRQQYPINVEYDGKAVGEYVADILVDDKVIVELKCVKEFSPAHIAQGLNYLKATEAEVCLLLNFGNAHLGIKRLVL